MGPGQGSAWVSITPLPLLEGMCRQGQGAAKRSTWVLHGAGLKSPFYSTDTERRGKGTARSEELIVLEQLQELAPRVQHLL